MASTCLTLYSHGITRLLKELDQGKNYLPKLANKKAIDIFKYGATKQTTLTKKVNGNKVDTVYYSPSTYPQIKSLLALCIISTMAHYPDDTFSKDEYETDGKVDLDIRINIDEETIKHTIPFFRLCYQAAHNSAVEIGVKPEQIQINDAVICINQTKNDIAHIDRDLTGILGRVDGVRTMFYDKNESSKFIDTVLEKEKLHLADSVNNEHNDDEQLKVIHALMDTFENGTFDSKLLSKPAIEAPPYTFTKAFGVQAGKQNVHLHRSPNQDEVDKLIPARTVKFNEVSKFIDGLKSLTTKQKTPLISDIITFADAHPNLVKHVEESSIFWDFSTRLGTQDKDTKNAVAFNPEKFSGFDFRNNRRKEDIIKTSR
jgi:hypothetical protein